MDKEAWSTAENKSNVNTKRIDCNCFSGHIFSRLTLILMVLQDHAPSSTVVHLGIAVSGMGSTRKELRWLKSKLLVLLSSKSKKNPTRSGGRWWLCMPGCYCWAGRVGFVAAQSVPIADPLFWGWPKESKSIFQTINGQRRSCTLLQFELQLCSN